jgi:DNA-binding XRE family transcriptional regulator
MRGRMDEERRKRLEADGWRIGSAADFLGMDEEETAYVTVKLALTRAFRSRRAAAGLTQDAVARRMGSSQSRVAKLEAGDPSVSLDLIVRALFAAGASAEDLAAAIHPAGG